MGGEAFPDKNDIYTGMTLLFVLGCIFFPLSFAILCWGLQNHSNLRMDRPEAVLVASKYYHLGRLNKNEHTPSCLMPST
ncbi:hypothetical protein VULLAG_LOCUS10833 [Vulpes lagopus]